MCKLKAEGKYKLTSNCCSSDDNHHWLVIHSTLPLSVVFCSTIWLYLKVTFLSHSQIMRLYYNGISICYNNENKWVKIRVPESSDCQLTNVQSGAFLRTPENGKKWNLRQSKTLKNGSRVTSNESGILWSSNSLFRSLEHCLLFTYCKCVFSLSDKV